MVTERIVSTPGICGGCARITGTRIPVWGLVQARRQGASIDLLSREYGVATGDVFKALEYAQFSPLEIEDDIANNH